jgi:hypothetical protein
MQSRIALALLAVLLLCAVFLATIRAPTAPVENAACQKWLAQTIGGLKDNWHQLPDATWVYQIPGGHSTRYPEPCPLEVARTNT